MSDKEQLPNMYRKHYQTGEDIKLSNRSTKRKLFKALLNKYYESANLSTRAFFTLIPRWKADMAINILCFRLNRDNPITAWKSACMTIDRIIYGASCTTGNKGTGVRGGQETHTKLLACCPHCGATLPPAPDEAEPHWHKIKDVTNVDKYGIVKHNNNTNL